MPSIADSLTPQVITEIFKQVQDYYYGPSEPFHDRTGYIRFFNAPSMMYDNENERRGFRHFRLVSRSWKAVSDTFVFRDLRITIGYPLFDKRRAVSGYHSAGHRFLEEMFGAGYAPLIRNVHLELFFNDHALQLPAPDLVEEVRSQVFASTDSVCKLLLEQSCRSLLRKHSGRRHAPSSRRRCCQQNHGY